MIDMILKWLYQNSAAIIISSLISLLISMMYAFEKYAHKYYTVKNIEWFQDYSIEKVIEKSKVSEKWRVDFDLMEQRKRTFMNLSIAKKVIKILQG